MKVLAAVTAVAAGVEMNVSVVCREAGVSRKTFYKWVARYRVEGLEGLEERSRAPHHVPHRSCDEFEDAVVRLRKELHDAGLDHGATTIQWHLGRDVSWRTQVRSVATIHRILVRRGLVVPAPKKRPKSAWQRFEAPAPNEWWQIDAMDWAIVTGPVKVFNLIDDHSRVATRSRAVFSATTEEAWTTFCEASLGWGFPAGMLSDNGLCFSGKLRGFEVFFEAQLRDVGVRPFTGRPYHPQTTGKVERFQQTLKRFLRRQPLAADLAQLQGQLDEFCRIYNFERPHQGIGRQTPISRWLASPRRGPASRPLEHPHPTSAATVIVNASGNVRVDEFIIHVGVEWAAGHATVLRDWAYATIFIDGHLVRHLKIDPSRAYQPSGRRRGGPRQPRQLPS